MEPHYVIIGAGQAGCSIIQTLARNGAKNVTLIGDEAYPPYQRPPLSKKFLSGNMTADRLFLLGETFFDDQAYTHLSSTTVIAIDRSKRLIHCDDRNPIPYDRLALATGARPRTLVVPGSDLKGVYGLKTIADVDKLRADAHSAQKIAIVGGGFIGLEVAAVLRTMGKAVTVYERQSRLMERAVGPEISEFFETTHKDQGVDIRLKAQIIGFEGEEGRVTHVKTVEGLEPAELVLVGIGVLPNDELAHQAGLDIADGILVDETAQTSDPSIVAAGDCTQHINPLYGRRLRLESVHNAIEQGKTAALNMLGQKADYAQIPWFWSDQYSHKLQMVGLKDAAAQSVVRGDLAGGKGSVFYFEDGQLTAIDSINSPLDHMIGRKILGQRTSLTPDQAADLSFNLKDLM